ncbi:MAG: hypothetical protein E7552_00470 [Ruminococcaceae bacterium]|nr:hypothetical protein [Oscillospiraceae bacterium]
MQRLRAPPAADAANADFGHRKSNSKGERATVARPWQQRTFAVAKSTEIFLARREKFARGLLRSREESPLIRIKENVLIL